MGGGGDSVLFARYTGGDSVRGGFCPDSSKHGYEKMPPKKAYVLVLGIFHKVHCMTTCTEFE